MTLCIPSAIGGTRLLVRVSGVLVVNGEEIAEVRTYNGDYVSMQQHQVANTAVVNCPAGGTVWVKCKDRASQIFGLATAPYTVFTGYAISFHP